MLDLGADLFTAVCVAPERPDEPVAYRKPSPRFIQEMLAAHEIAADAAWMVGDSPSDWQAGLNAGVRVAAIVGAAPAGPEAEGLLAHAEVTPFASLIEWARTL
jgi:D-glycero-D-manno-heptose 1,7-bisphosphate phosphatase